MVNYKLRLLLLSILTFIFASTQAQLVVNSGITPAQLVASFLGPGLTVSNINLIGAPASYGTFSNGTSTNLGINNGVILTTGAAINAKGANNSSAFTTVNGMQYSDPDLIKIERSAISDPCILTFNVVPKCNILTIKFVFGSEEYHEFVNSKYNDAFGFFISGPNPGGGNYTGYNIARLPNNAPVSINSVNNGYSSARCSNGTDASNPAYFTDNCSGTTIQYDGFTKLITANLSVVPCQTYTFKIAIADAGDYRYDSGVFINSLFCSTAVAYNTSATESCPSLCNGSASVTSVSGGFPPYTYSWSNGQTGPTATGLCPETYTVTVQDNTGCNSLEKAITINSLPSPSLNITSTNNVSCNGGTNASVTASAIGGTGSIYTYMWMPTGGTHATATGLSAGSYTVTVADERGCSKTKSINLTEPTVLTNTVAASSNVSCNGGSDGTAIAIATGGTIDYTYTWTPGGKTGASVTGLSAGNYAVTATDSKGCTATSILTISQPSLLTNSISSSTNVNCFGGKNGAATATVGGGAPPYTYFWNPSGQVTNSATGLSAGTYYLSVYDSNGCSNTLSITITEPTLLTNTISASSNVSCNGGNDGSATVSVTGGTQSYFYLWTPTNQTSAIATGLSTGNYSVTVTDALGCTNTTSVSITQPTILASNISSSSNVSCNGGSNGTAIAMATGGTLMYTYSWIPSGQTTSIATGLSVGNYSITITDALGCTKINSVNISQPSALTNSISSIIASCSLINGSATANPSGGTSGYTFLWSPGSATTQAISGLAGGNYSVIITDKRGCTISNSVTVGSTSAPSATTSVTPASCGTNNGTGTTIPSGGKPNYTYLWTEGQTTQTATGLSPGTYSVTVCDENGCTAIAGINVIAANGPTVSITPPKNDVSCFGGNNGTATAMAVGGNGTYTYSWSNGQTTSTATGLSAGTYSVVIRDALNCSYQISVRINQPNQPLVTDLASSLNVSCNNGNDGIAIASISGGTPDYTYKWNTNATTSAITDLTVGLYSVSITDGRGCTSANSITITEPIILTTLSTATAVACFGENSGLATTNPTGGTPLYTFLWNNGQTTSTVTGLTIGTYSVLIKDSKGCTYSDNISITEPVALTNIPSKDDVICNGQSNGSISVNASGGTKDYTYLWANNQTTSSITGIPKGTYSILITDAKGCTTTNTITISEPSLLASGITNTNATCNGANSGSATVMPWGGTFPYSFFWSNGATTSVATGLSTGNYSVMVTDSHSCTITNTVVISEPNLLTSTFSQSSNGCYGDSSGTAIIKPSGGTPIYKYLWSTGQTTSSISYLRAGAYTVSVTDTKGCSLTNTITITQPDLLTSTITKTDIACYGDSSGNATVNILGGTINYTYTWENGETTSTVSGLSIGTYSVLIKDANGCTKSNSVIIQQPSLLSTIINSQKVKCFGENSGVASIIPSGGSPIYTFLWNNGKTTSGISGLNAGTYTVTLTDSKGCVKKDTINVLQPSLLDVSIGQSNVSCAGDSTGFITADPFGGTAPYLYNWNNGSTDSKINRITAGTYSVEITDANSCQTTNKVIITQPFPLKATTSQINVACNGGNSGIAIVEPYGGVSPYVYNWNNGQTISTATNLSQGDYSVIITDANLCTATVTFIITQSPPITVVIQGNYSVCIGQPLVLNALLTNGTAPYTYNWIPGNETTSVIQVRPISNTTYSVSVQDANKCTSTSQSFTVKALPTPIAKFDTALYGKALTSGYRFTDLSSGGIQWSWIFGDGNFSSEQDPIHYFPGAGTYNVLQVVTNQFGCIDTTLLKLIIPYRIIIPNVFTPDGDGNNDEFYIPNSGVEEFHITIFDRWGLQIFESTSDEIHWNGKSPSGKTMVDGTYFYVLDAKLITDVGKQEKITYRGTVTLLTNRK